MRASFRWKAGEDEARWWWCVALVGGGPASLVVWGDIVSIESCLYFPILSWWGLVILFLSSGVYGVDR